MNFQYNDVPHSSVAQGTVKDLDLPKCGSKNGRPEHLRNGHGACVYCGDGRDKVCAVCGRAFTSAGCIESAKRMVSVPREAKAS